VPQHETTPADRYPNLLTPLDSPGASGRFIVSPELPEEADIGNVYLVPRMGEQWVYLVETGGKLQFPGGKKGPGESHRQALARELLEEAGAELIDANVVGHWWIHSKSGQPLAPHLPYPDSAGVVFCGQVQLVGLPTNPGGAGQTAEVVIGDLSDAVAAFRSHGRADLADLYQLAAELLPR